MRKRFVLPLLALAFATSCLFVLFYPQELLRSPFEDRFVLTYPSFATTDSDGNTYVIDNSLGRIRKIARDGSLVFELNGGRRDSGQFFLAVELAVDPQGFLYVLNQVMQPSGFYTGREEILRYDPKGRLDRILGSRTYSHDDLANTLVNRGNYLALTADLTGLSWFETGDTSLTLNRMSYDSWQLVRTPVLQLENLRQMLAGVVRIDDETLAWSTKTGEVWRAHLNNPPELVDKAPPIQAGQLPSVPWWLGSDSMGHLVLSDLGRREIVKLAANGRQTLLSTALVEQKTKDATPTVYYLFSLNTDGRLTTVSETSVLSLSPAGELDTVLSGGTYQLPQLIQRVLVWLGLGCGLALVLISGLWLYRNLVRNRLGLLVKQLLLLLPLVVGLMAVTTQVLVGYFNQKTEEQAFFNISQTIQVISKAVDAERLERLQNLTDYFNDDYQFVRRQLHTALNFNLDPWNNKYYFALHRPFDGSLYTMMYLNDGVTLLHPFNYLNDPANLYHQASGGKIVTAKIPDAFGSWILGVGPIYDKAGNLAGLLEIGRDMYGFQQETQAVLASMLPFSALAFMVILGLFFVLTWFFLQPLRQLRRRMNQGDLGVPTPPLPIRGDDEVAHLTLGFNKLSVFLTRYQEEVLQNSLSHPALAGRNLLLALRPLAGEGQAPADNFRQLETFYGLVLPAVRAAGGQVQLFQESAVAAMFPADLDPVIRAAIEIARQKQQAHLPDLRLVVLHLDQCPVASHPPAELLEELHRLTKNFGTDIMVLDESRGFPSETSPLTCRALGPAPVRSLAEGTELVEVLDGSPAQVLEHKVRSASNLTAGISRYLAGDCLGAQSEFSKALVLHAEDTAARHYLKLCRQKLAGADYKEAE